LDQSTKTLYFLELNPNTIKSSFSITVGVKAYNLMVFPPLIKVVPWDDPKSTSINWLSLLK